MVGYWLRFPQVVPSTLPKETKSGSPRQLAPPVVTMASGEEMGQVHPVKGDKNHQEWGLVTRLVNQLFLRSVMMILEVES